MALIRRPALDRLLETALVGVAARDYVEGIARLAFDGFFDTVVFVDDLVACVARLAGQFFLATLNRIASRHLVQVIGGFADNLNLLATLNRIALGDLMARVRWFAGDRTLDAARFSTAPRNLVAGV